jgi:O-antigen/teichoic acid export membrane protein
VQIRRSLWITLAYSNLGTILMFVVAMALARILTPRDIGVFTLCVAAINFAGVLRDFGTVQYLISKGEATSEDAGAVLGLTLISSWVLAAALWLGRHALAAWFNEPQVAEVLPVILIGFLLIPLSSLMNALLTRDLSASRSAVVNIGSNLIYAVVVLALALRGYGALSAAWANAANVASNVLLFLVVMPKGFRLRPRFSGWGPPVRYGSGVLLSSMAQAASQALPDVVTGRTLGVHDVGLFSRAMGTVGLFQVVVGPTLTYNALPIIAREHRDKPAGVVSVLVKSATLLTVLAWPVYAWIAGHAKALIELLYGASWTAAADLVPWLCLAAAVRTPYLIVTPALQAVGKNFQNSRAQSLNFVIRAVVLLLFGLQDLRHLVMALCLAEILCTLPWAWEAWRHLDLSTQTLMRGLRGSMGVGVICGFASLAVRSMQQGQPMLPLLEVLLSSAAVAGAWLAAVFLFKHPVADELQRALGRGRGSAADASREG